MLKIFTNAYKGNATDKVAIDTSKVVSVYVSNVEDTTNVKRGQKGPIKAITSIYIGEQSTFYVEESFEDVVNLINQE